MRQKTEVFSDDETEDTSVCDDETEDRSSWINSEVYRDILSAQIQSNGAKLIGWRFIVQMDSDPKRNPGVFEDKKAEYSAMAESISWSEPDWTAFHSLKTKLKTERATNKQQLKSAAVKTWQTSQRRNPVSDDVHEFRIKAVIACKGFSTKY